MNKVELEKQIKLFLVTLDDDTKHDCFATDRELANLILEDFLEFIKNNNHEDNNQFILVGLLQEIKDLKEEIQRRKDKESFDNAWDGY